MKNSKLASIAEQGVRVEKLLGQGCIRQFGRGLCWTLLCKVFFHTWLYFHAPAAQRQKSLSLFDR